MVTTTTPLRELTAADLMSRDVVCIPERMPLRAAACLLRQARVTGAPVVDEAGRCVGVLSAVDFLRWVEGGPEAGNCPPRSCPYQTVGRLLNGEEAVVCALVGGSCPLQGEQPLTGGRHAAVCLRPVPAGRLWSVIARLPLDAVGRFMTADVVAVGPGTPLPELARMMVDAHIHRLAVLDDQGRPVGIVSSTDVLAALMREEQRQGGPCRGEATDSAEGSPRTGGTPASPCQSRALPAGAAIPESIGASEASNYWGEGD
jgi:CBS domain-containing protein